MEERLRRLVERWRTLRAQLSKPRTRLLAATVGALLFGGGLVVSWTSLDLDLSDLSPIPLALAGLLSFTLPLLNALEYRLTAQSSGVAVTLVRAYRVTVVASVLNMLPIPAGVAVRLEGLRRDGLQLSSAVWASALVTLAWLSIAATLGGLALLANHRWLLGAALVAGGLAVGAPSIVGFGRGGLPAKRHAGLDLVVLETAYVIQRALRLWLVTAALGSPITIDASLVLAAGSVLATIVGLVPGALGLAEGLTAALSPVVGVSPALGFVAASVLRMLTLVATGLAAIPAWSSLGRRAIGEEAQRPSSD